MKYHGMPKQDNYPSAVLWLFTTAWYNSKGLEVPCAFIAIARPQPLCTSAPVGGTGSSHQACLTATAPYMFNAHLACGINGID